MSGRGFLLAALVGLLCLVARGEAGGEFLGKPTAEWITILRDGKSSKARTVAVLALKTIGHTIKGVAPALLDALRDDPEPEIRREIATVLGQIGPEFKGAAEALGDRLANDKADVVRQAAAAALGGKLAKEAEGQVKILANAIKDKHEGTRRAAVETLKNMGELAQPAVPQLVAVAKDTSADRFSRVYAIQVISQWGADNKDTGPALVAIIGDKDAHITVRQAAAEGLGRLADYPAGVEALGQVLVVGQAELRRTAAVALGQLGAKSAPAWSSIKKTIANKSADSAVRFALIRATASLAAQHADAVPLLVELARTDDAVENRVAAIQELGELGSVAKSAVPVLEDIAKGDARANIRQAAEVALKKIMGT